ncbi:putative secreted protein [Listeria fleischmannii subsp. coloradonensis]|uniref:DUF1433 domain-containing protein n=1 Tax=Listeria fleischmannii TaxID=1069827 RepID=UPI000254F773|nr:DUF1433 domain-containing protein [Listeria fleischmannii]EIA20012.1 putative secreted protein [Listeria fleischmannii subsp. coloradonensis]
MKHQEKELIQEQKPRIEKYLSYNYNNISVVTLTNVYTNPTGVIHIEGYINNNKKLKIDAPLDGKNGVEVVDTSTYIYENYMKEKYKFKSTNVSDIEAKEKAKKKEKKSSTLNINNTRSAVEILDDIKTVEQNIFNTYPKHSYQNG